jgi:hypothetical protein
MMNSNRVLKVVTILLLVGCIVPSTEAKSAVEFEAVGIGAITKAEFPLIVSLQAKLSPNEEGDYVGVGRMSYLESNDDLADYAEKRVYIQVEMEGGGPLGVTVSTAKGLSLTITPMTVLSKTKWITYDASLNGQTIALSLVWRLHLNSPTATIDSGEKTVFASARGTASLGEREAPISVDLAALVSENGEDIYKGPALLKLGIVGSEKQGEVMTAVLSFTASDPDNLDSVFLTVNTQTIPITYDVEKKQYITEGAEVTLSSGTTITIDLVWRYNARQNGIGGRMWNR